MAENKKQKKEYAEPVVKNPLDAGNFTDNVEWNAAKGQ